LNLLWLAQLHDLASLVWQSNLLRELLRLLNETVANLVVAALHQNLSPLLLH